MSQKIGALRVAPDSGDDTEHLVNQLERWMGTLPSGAPFLASLWLHTVHTPHAALPDFFHAYRDARGQPAGERTLLR